MRKILKVLCIGIALGATLDGANPQFYGKSLWQLKESNPELAQSIDGIQWDLRAFNWGFYKILGPSKQRRKNIKRVLRKLKELENEIEKCLKEANAKLTQQSNSQNHSLELGNESLKSGNLLTATFFLPWIFIEAAAARYSENGLKADIETMKKAKKEILSLIIVLTHITQLA
ncbi:MAG TPA: hypothetical protein VLH77_03555 [Gammaproteobacteria bacterium]|nr:hypothetical protein [Gammaproteobacteria bacterium]